MGAEIAFWFSLEPVTPTIASFESREAELRRQVEVAGGDAATVYAADKLSDILVAGCAGRSKSTATRRRSASAPASRR